jgi:ribosomal protein S18 acetylase RimI-like enzyme
MAFEAFNGDTSRRCSTALAPPPAPGGYSSAMPNATTAKSSAGLSVRRSKPSDLDALWDLENQVFDTNRMSRRSLRRLLAVPTAAVLVAEDGGRFAGAAIVLFRANSAIGRLYSLAVAPRFTGRGIGSALVTAVEKAARSRKCRFVRLEVHEKNHGAIVCYRKAGFEQFDRHHEYYEDKGHALRFEKRLAPR